MRPYSTKLALSFATLAIPLTFAANAGAAVLTHSYAFNDGTDSLGGPALTSNGGTFANGLYTFGAGQGLVVSNAIANPADYSIYFRVSLEDLNGYKRLLDFKDRTSDTGFYFLNAHLNFFNVATGAGTFLPNTFNDVVITRDDATDLVTGYVNGVQEFQFLDSSDLAVFTGPNAIAHFFEDDNAVGGEQGPGAVDVIQIYNGPLTAAEVAVLPEPSALAPAIIAALFLRRRR